MSFLLQSTYFTKEHLLFSKDFYILIIKSPQIWRNTCSYVLRSGGLKMKIDPSNLLKNILKSNKPIGLSDELHNIELAVRSLPKENGIKILQERPHIAADSKGKIAGSYLGVPTRKTVAPVSTNWGGAEKNEIGALKQYMSGESYALNDQLRRNMELSPQQKHLVTNLDKALDKMPVYDKLTYRNIQFDLAGQEEYNRFIAQHKVGAVVNYPAYTSTSKSFDGYTFDEDTKNVASMIIKGKNGRNIATHGLESEAEVLFKRNSKFEVLNAQVNKEGASYFELRETD